jgi:hypothetical protein
MNDFFKEHYKEIYQEWITPSDVKDKTILDLGSQFGWLGTYCVDNSVKEYVGVELDPYAYHRAIAENTSSNIKFFHMDLEDYLNDCISKQISFDIAIISRTLEGSPNQVSILQKLSKTVEHIILEVTLPINIVAYDLLAELEKNNPTNQTLELIEKTKYNIEYKSQFVEYFDYPGKPIWAIPSIGMYNAIMTRLGFQMSLDTYERVKQKWPTEYGFFQRGKAILKFKRIKNETMSITWKECIERSETF